jgi:hypothetical protein
MKTMKTIETSAGKPYGHVPGHDYHDVDCMLREQRGGYVCVLTETWGTGDEERGRNICRGVGPTPDGACRDAISGFRGGDDALRHARTTCAAACERADAEGGAK